MVVRAEYWTHGFSRIALYFIDEKFRGSYPVSGITAVDLIPSEYYLMRILRIAFGLS
jgi:hypothetical protein